MAKSAVLISAALDLGVYLLLGCALASWIADCPWTKYLWAACVFMAVMAVRDGLTARLLRQVRESAEMVDEAKRRLFFEASRENPPAKPVDPVEELCAQAAVPRGAD